MRLLPVVFAFLVACKGPNLTETCIETTTAEFDLCDIDVDANTAEEIEEQCMQAAGYAQGVRCANDASVYEKCRRTVLASNPDCEDVDEELDACSYELGLLNGCLDRR